MNQLQKYTWLLDTIRRATFNRWRDAIFEQFSIIIDCQKVGGYLYYIANPEDIDEDKLKK